MGMRKQKKKKNEAAMQVTRCQSSVVHDGVKAANAAIANYNIEFNQGKFYKDKKYKYRINPKNSAQVLVTTEKGTEQDLWFTEFDTLFTILKN